MDTVKVKQYFERIGLEFEPEKIKPDFELLKKLQYAHVITVPYENLDILAGVPLKLDAEGLFDKIVAHKRGGYCFELNGLFKWLLCELGYNTLDCFARFWRGSDSMPKRRHRVIIAWSDFTDGRILCDTGVGSPAPRYPLRLEPDIIQEQFGETYRFKRDSEFGWVIEELHKGEWRRYFSFTEEPQYDIDYIMPSYFCEMHTDSPFNKEPMLAVKTLSGRVTVDGNVFRIFDGDSVEERIIHSKDEMNGIYRKYFGL